MSLTLRGIIFDMDGVLTDSEPFIIEAATNMFAERHHLAVKHDDFLPFTGAGEDRFLGGVAEKYGVRLAMPDDKLGTYAIYLELIRGRLHPLAGAVEFIEECRRRNLKCALATSADRVKMEGNLREIRIPPDRFDAIVTGSEIERKKPDPQVFQAAAERMALSNTQCIVVEDAVNGVKAGKAAGSRVLGITTSFSAAALKAAGADWIAPDLAHVPEDVFSTMPHATPPSPTLAWLVPIMGPAMEVVELEGHSRGMLVGRLEHCNVRLPVDSVSRNHARIRFDGVRWCITDLKSRWGTFVNGVKIEPNCDVPLAEGDLLRIIPWTFRFSTSRSAKTGLLEGALESVDDSADAFSTVQAVSAERLPSLTDEMLGLLLESASEIHAANDEKTLAETLLDKACLGSGLPNAWVLKPAGTGARLEVIASRSPAGASIAYSRSLLNAASDGQMAELSTERQEFDSAVSIVSMGVRTALCVPLMLGQTVAAYLYLDSRGDPNSAHRLPLRPHAAAFCRALGKMSSLAMANLKRVEMERRTAAVEADLAAASAAQQWILPKRDGKLGPFIYTGESRPGEGLGGDFYDLLLLDGDRLAVAIGDVSGHGITASVLMTACSGYLHAMLQETGDPTLSVHRLNQFIGPRRMEKFVTLWVGVLDLPRRTLQYVDAGHGYALLADPAGDWQQLGGDQIPIGVVDDFPYKSLTVPIPTTGRLLLVSDGIVEQFDPPGDTPELKQFGFEGIESATRAIPPDADIVAALFDAVVKHAGRTKLTDDATAVVVSWG